MKILSLTCLSILLFGYPLILAEKSDAETKQLYQVNAPDWSEKEYQDYYIDNHIFPANPPDGTDVKLELSDVPNHLSTRFNGYSNWTISSSGTNSVSSTYGGEPIEVSEANDTFLTSAKINAGLENQLFIGCGPLALYTQLDYLARFGEYSQFHQSLYPDAIDYKEELATSVFSNVDTIPAESWLGQSLDIDPTAGTFTFPSSLIAGAKRILVDYKINKYHYRIYPNGDPHYDYNSDAQLAVYGDALPSAANHATKIAQLKDSIDKGMPIIWWTFNTAGDFGGHYMNIFAYENWIGVNSLGQTQEHLMFRLRFNQGMPDIYMDSDILNATNCGFIFFEEKCDKILLTPPDYNYTQQYFFYEKSETLEIRNHELTTKRLRTGYINENGGAGTGDWHITMSAKRQGAGIAYHEYHLDDNIDYIYFDIRLWSMNEGIGQANCDILLQYMDEDEEWITQLDLYQTEADINGITTLIDFPKIFRVDFPEGTKNFRFYSSVTTPIGSTNKGRVVIDSVGIVFSPETGSGEEDGRLFMTIYALDTYTPSASVGGGHAWIEIYNDSNAPIQIGKLIVDAYNSVSLGAYDWGCSSYDGVYYNLENYRRTFHSDNRVSMTEVIELSAAETISEVINDSDGPFGLHLEAFGKPCSFAIDIWNAASDSDFEKSILVPFTPVADLMEQIEIREGHQINRDMRARFGNVGYFSGDDFVFSTT